MNQEQKKDLLRIIIGSATLLSAILINRLFSLPKLGFLPLSLLLFLIPYFISGYEIIEEAAKAVKEKEFFDENQLMLVASVGAFITGDYAEAVVVVLFYQIGEWFEHFAVEKNRKAVATLAELCPQSANIERNGKIEKIEPEQLHCGDTVVIKPGERIPVDCRITRGNTYIDTRALTGESLPRFAKEGDELLSGFVNNDSIIYAEVTKEYKNSAAAKIIQLVENASSQKAPTEHFVTKFAKVYTPTVVIAAFLLATVPLLFGGEFTVWLKRACTFLVISCPCALVISVPMSIYGGIGSASRKGILIKGGAYLESLSRVTSIAFDKTGTLTKGNFKVTEARAKDGKTDYLTELAAAVEKYSNHPIARSLKETCKTSLHSFDVSDVKEIAGKGLTATVNGKSVLVGTRDLLSDRFIPCPPNETPATAVYIAENNEYLGTILIRDEIKASSYEAIKSLKERENIKTLLLTGDRNEVAESVARELKIDDYYAELLPQEKAEKAKELIKAKKPKEKFAFVGDGINDAPVLAISDIGIAMGGIGSDAAVEIADIVITDDNPEKIPIAVHIAKRTMGIAKENIVFALIVKIAVLLLGLFGIASMWFAVFADVGVTVIAVLNALRLLKNE